MPGYLRAELLDVVRLEHLVHAAMALPEQHAAARGSPRGVLPPSSRRGSQTGIAPAACPSPGRVAAQVLIGEEQHPPPPGEGPLQHRPGVGRGADDPAVPAAKGLQAGRRVDVGDRRHVVDVDHFGQLLPAVLHLLDLRPCRPSSSRRPGRAGPRSPAGRRAGPAARGGWPGCRPFRP